jgi:hypothetical protein
MMIFPSSMKPKALLQNKGQPHPFKCDLCGESDEGVCVQPDDSERSAWAVLPEEWEEVEDRRPKVKQKFMIVCSSSECLHKAHERANVG